LLSELPTVIEKLLHKVSDKRADPAPLDVSGRALVNYRDDDEL